MSRFRYLPTRCGAVAVLCAVILGVGDVRSEDKIFRKGSRTPTQGTILRVEDASVRIALPGGAGETAMQRAEIDRVEIVVPKDVEAGIKASLEGNSAASIKLLEPIYTQYRGLPQDWIEEMSIRLGESYLSAKDWTKAHALFAGFLKFYPKSPFHDNATSGNAECLFHSNQPEQAAKLLEAMIAERDKEVAVNDEQSRAMGRACVVLGRSLLASNKNETALEAFLKTTVLYYKDPSAVAEALYESSLLFDKMNNPSRARSQLETLVRDFPNSTISAEARKKLEASQKTAKPEESKP